MSEARRRTEERRRREEKGKGPQTFSGGEGLTRMLRVHSSAGVEGHGKEAVQPGKFLKTEGVTVGSPFTQGLKTRGREELTIFLGASKG